ncbi:MAG: hypothetical protein ACI906_000703 [Candidatus Latescibacterota bacterium]|jgi:hypothetical protein
MPSRSATALVEKLLAQTPELIRQADTLGNGPLHWAALTRQTDLIDLFLEWGAARGNRRADGITPLLTALNGALGNGSGAAQREIAARLREYLASGLFIPCFPQFSCII